MLKMDIKNRVQGFQNSRILGSWGSRVKLDIKIGFKNSRIPGFHADA